MRLISGLLRFDGAAAEAAELEATARAMTAPGLTPRLSMRLEGALGLAVLDFGRDGPAGEVCETGAGLIAADARLDRVTEPAETVLAAAEARHGADYPDRVDGDFAVATWSRARRELRLARDFIGVRPLVWTLAPGRFFAFASLPKGLHGAGLAEGVYDPEQLAAAFSQIWFQGPAVGFRDIAGLPAGHTLTISLDDPRPRLHRAYRPDPARVGTWRGSPEAAAAELRRLIVEAVESRLPAGGAVASHLSGGLDSSAVTVLAARGMRARGGRTIALTWTTPTALGPRSRDERPMIDAVLAQEADLARHAAFDRLPVAGAPVDPDWPLDTAATALDETMAAAAAFGAERLLTGIGGDEGATYNGANLYVRLLAAGRIGQLLRELRTRARLEGMSPWVAVRRRVLGPLVPDRLRLMVWRWLGRASTRDPARGLTRFVAPGLHAALAARRFRPILQTNTAEERVAAFADHHIPSRLAHHALVAARYGLAATHPLLDRRVVDFALSLPVWQFLADGQSRQPYRRAMAGILPDVVRLATHKLGTGDDRIVRAAALKADWLAEVARLGGDAHAEGLVNLAEIAAGIGLLPDPEAATAVVEAVGRGENPLAGVPRWRIFGAVGALGLARNVARVGGRAGGPVAAQSKRDSST